MKTISTSNGPLTLDPPTLRGERVTIDGLQRLEQPTDGYTHLVAMHDDERGMVGSALISLADARHIGAIVGLEWHSPICNGVDCSPSCIPLR